MKLLNIFATAIATASAIFTYAQGTENALRLNTTASGIDINNLGLSTGLVSYANSSIWIGGIKAQIYAEPFLVESASGGLSFTSFHGVPTGWQLGYVFINETEPVGFTIPHSGAVPSGAEISGWGFSTQGYLQFQGKNKFIGCQSSAEATSLRTWQIWWRGKGAPPKGYNCTGKLYLYLDGCSTIG